MALTRQCISSSDAVKCYWHRSCGNCVVAKAFDLSQLCRGNEVIHGSCCRMREISRSPSCHLQKGCTESVISLHDVTHFGLNSSQPLFCHF